MRIEDDAVSLFDARPVFAIFGTDHSRAGPGSVDVRIEPVFTRNLKAANQSTAALECECCLVAWRSHDKLFIQMSIEDLDALQRRDIDNEADSMHRAGLSEWRCAEQFLREIERRLSTAEGLLRASIGSAIHRKRLPRLKFRLAPEPRPN